MNSKTLLTLVFFLALSVRAAEMLPPETGYSAVRTMNIQGSSFQANVFYEDSKERSEISMSGQSMVTIMRQDLGVLWMIMPGGVYMEQPLNSPQSSMTPGQVPQPPMLTDPSQTVELNEEGRDQINGFDTTRYRFHAEDTDGTVAVGQIWLTEDNIAVQTRMSFESGSQTGEVHITLSDLDIGDQPDELFEVPEGYQLFSLSGMPGASFGGPASSGNADDSGFSDALTDAVKEGVEDAVIDETQRGARDAVSRRLRGLFDRD